MHKLPLLQRPDIDRVVVFRALQLGDMLCAVPALRALRAALPAAHVTLVGLPWAEQFARRFSRYVDDFVAFPGHPGLPEQPVREDETVAFYERMRTHHASLALQLHGSGETSNGIVAAFGAAHVAGFVSPGQAPPPGFHALPFPSDGAEPVRLLSLVEWLGAPADDGALEFPLTEEDRDELRRSGVAAALGAGDYLCIHPGARSRDKCWPAQNFARVGDALAREFGLGVVLTGSAGEAALAADVASRMTEPAVNAAAPISIGAMAALMNGSRLLVCNDTGVSHIAAGLGLRSVVIFSKADMRRWAPLDRERHRCLRDPEGRAVEAVLMHARELLGGTGRRSLSSEASSPAETRPRR